MKHPNKRIAGVEYDLSHLDPFDMTVTHRPASAVTPFTYNVRVSFGVHTFTRDLEAEDTPDYHYPDGQNTRCFCPLRHARSIHLPGIIRAAVNGPAYFGNRAERFILLEQVNGANVPYMIAFGVERGRRRPNVSMFVVSAHERPNLPTKLPKIGFATLISLTAQGKSIKRPKK